MNNKKVLKNHIILILILIITILATFYLRNIYIAEKQYNATNSIIQKVANQINENEIDNYLMENPNAILYVSSGQNPEIKGFEQQLKTLLEKQGLTNQTIYINKDTIDNQESFIKKIQSLTLKEENKNKLNKSSDSAIYIFENGKIKYAIIDANHFNINHIKKLFKNYGVIENE